MIDMLEINAQIIAITERAIQVRSSPSADPVWLPLSHLEASPAGSGGQCTLTMPRWLALEAGIVPSGLIAATRQGRCVPADPKQNHSPKQQEQTP